MNTVRWRFYFAVVQDREAALARLRESELEATRCAVEVAALDQVPTCCVRRDGNIGGVFHLALSCCVMYLRRQPSYEYSWSICRTEANIFAAVPMLAIRS